MLERRHDVDQGEGDGRPVNYIVLGEAEKAIRVYMTEDGIVHWAGRPIQVVVDAPQCVMVDWGRLKEYTEVLLYGILKEGKGKEVQQLVLNDDGTLSPMHSKHFMTEEEVEARFSAYAKEIRISKFATGGRIVIVYSLKWKCLT